MFLNVLSSVHLFLKPVEGSNTSPYLSCYLKLELFMDMCVMCFIVLEWGYVD